MLDWIYCSEILVLASGAEAAKAVTTDFKLFEQEV